MDDLEAALAPVHAQIAAFSRRQADCKALAGELYGVGPLVAAIVWAFLGDARRFSSSAQAVHPQQSCRAPSCVDSVRRRPR
jgi:transposase